MEKLVGHKRGSVLYADENHFLYRINRQREGTLYLQCEEHNCKGFVVYVPGEGGSVRVTKPHNDHFNRIERVISLRFREMIRQAAVRHQFMPPKEVFERTQMACTESAPYCSYESVRGLIASTREQFCPPVPQNLHVLNDLFMDTE